MNPIIHQHIKSAAATIELWKEKKRRIIFTNGCFDIIHPGHISCLKQSKLLGDKLIVGLNTDASVKILKGPHRPVHNEVDRALVLAAIRYVDLVILFNEDTPVNLINAIRPYAITKGGDYKATHIPGADIVVSYGGKVVILDFIEGYSSTNIFQHLKSHTND